MKTFLCIEDGKKFLIKAKSWEDAREIATKSNAQVVFKYARNGERIYNEQNKMVEEVN
jgi:hypothetical protein